MHRLLAGVAALAIAGPFVAVAQTPAAKSAPAAKTPAAKAATAAAAAGGAPSASPFDGTWKTDPRSVTFSGKPSEFDLSGGMFSCASCAPPMRVKADGTPQPVAGNPFIDTLTVTVVDDHDLKTTGAKGGKKRGEQDYKVSADGKTLTVSFQGRPLNPGGAPANIVRTYARVTDGAAGAHAVSGTWKRTGTASMSGAAGVDTFKMEGGMLHWSSPSGASYVAGLDGKPYPMKGDPGVDHVSLKKISDSRIVETDWLKGKKVDVTTWSVSASGKTLTIVDNNPETGVTSTARATRR